MRRAAEMARQVGLAAFGLSLCWPLSPAWASAESAFVKSLDRPTSTKVVHDESSADLGQITCTYYADLMVRETGTDSPEPNNATLKLLPKGAARPACSAAALAGAVTLKTEGYALQGRKGGFLIWDVSDPNGAEPFMVMEARTGRSMFMDGLSPTPGLRRAATLENGLLHLKYTRGYNAPCSIAQNAQGCWSKIVAAGGAPKSMPALTRAPASCLAAYRHTQADDPSVVTYTVDMTLDAAGKATLLSHGAVSCQPQP
jgi:hypothetical protein